MTWDWLDERPIVVAIAGSNGAGKTTFYHAHLAASGLRFVNADEFALELDVDAYVAAQVADGVRRELVRQQVSFAFETVFSDPVRDKINFLLETADAGYTVVLCFIGLFDASMSEQRVSMRVSQGGHDVPTEKIKSRFPRTLANLKAAIVELPRVLIFDNSDLGLPYQRLARFEQARFEQGQSVELRRAIPYWLKNALP